MHVEMDAAQAAVASAPPAPAPPQVQFREPATRSSSSGRRRGAQEGVLGEAEHAPGPQGEGVVRRHREARHRGAVSPSLVASSVASSLTSSVASSLACSVASSLFFLLTLRLSPSPPQVMFGDICDSTAMSESLDAEDVREVVLVYQKVRGGLCCCVVLCLMHVADALPSCAAQHAVEVRTRCCLHVLSVAVHLLTSRLRTCRLPVCCSAQCTRWRGIPFVQRLASALLRRTWH